MPIPFPELKPQVIHGRSVLKPAEERWRLPYPEWVPLLEGIYRAKTIGEQAAALRYGICMVGAYADRLENRKNSLAHATLGYTGGAVLHGRFVVATPPEEPRLKFARATLGPTKVEVAYTTEGQTIYDWLPSGHQVYTDETTPLNQAGRDLSKLATTALATQLHIWYPGFEMPQQLASAGIELAQINK